MYDELVKRLRDLAGEQMFDFERQPYLQAADAIEELSHDYEKLAEDFNGAVELLHKKSKPSWIPVTERVPDNRRDVQITAFWHDAWRTMYGYYDGAYWHLYTSTHIEVTDVYVIGWMEKPTPMPLPEPPKEET